MRYYLIAGEASGDLHGSNLMRALREKDPHAVFRFWGGDRMASVGGSENLARHYKTASFFGVSEILRHLPEILSQVAECRSDITEFAPDVLIAIDYPGFNFKMVKFAHDMGIRTIYYISPKVWAWNSSRVKLIRRYVDNLFIIFPFEVDYFRRRGIEAVYEGNPIMDSIASAMTSLPTREQFCASRNLDNRPIVALLAGSRKSEIKHTLPFMVRLAARFPDYQFVVAGVSWIDPQLYGGLLDGSGIKLVTDSTYALLKYSAVAVVTSGTATLETALIGTPEVVCYRMDAFSYWVARLFVKIRFVSLVNIILGREAVRELLQYDMTVDNAATELAAVMPGGAKHDRQQSDYDELRQKIGGAGASDRFAARIISILKQSAG